MRVWKLGQVDWSHTLYRSHDGYVLSVLCGGVGLYVLNIPLSDDEARRYLVDESAVAELAALIRSAPHVYAARSVVLDGSTCAGRT